MSKLLLITLAFGLVAVSAPAFAQKAQKPQMSCEDGCLRRCSGAGGSQKSWCQQRCTSSCYQNRAAKK